MKNRNLAVGAAVLALMAPAAVEAQCPSSPAVSSLGITLVQCDCTVGSSNADAWRFTTPPRVLGVAPGSAAAGALREGDVIMQVNGRAITTPEGAAAFARIRDGGSATLFIQRNGRNEYVTLRPTELCAREARIIAVAPGVNVAALRATTMAPPATVQGTPGVAAARTAKGQGGPGVAAARTATVQGVPSAGGGGATPLIASTVAPSAVVGARGQAVALAPSVASVSTGWVGIAFSCDDCTVDHANARWIFRSAPEVYSVEVGSPAYVAGMRRGDVLTHVDGVSITTPEGGRRWAQVKPGQSIRVNYQRSGGVRVATIVASPQRGVLAPTMAQGNVIQRTRPDSDALSTALRDYERMLQQQSVREEQTLRRMLEARASDENADAVLREYLEVQEQARRERQARTEQLLRQAPVLDTRPGVAIPLTASVNDQRLRFSGVLGGTEVEVRGLNSVVVTERGDEIIITTTDATIRVKVPRRD